MFDSVNHKVVLQVLVKLRYQEEYEQVLIVLNNNISAIVISGSEDESEPFWVDVGVKQFVTAKTILYLYCWYPPSHK